jgi:hypothetical protein
VLHSGMLWPYSQILEHAGKASQGKHSSLFGVSVSDGEKKLCNWTLGVNEIKLFFGTIYTSIRVFPMILTDITATRRNYVKKVL